MCWEERQGRKKEETIKCMQGKKLQGSPLHCKEYRVNDGLYTPLGHKAAVKLKH